jgi:hypothetical protein
MESGLRHSNRHIVKPRLLNMPQKVIVLPTDSPKHLDLSTCRFYILCSYRLNYIEFTIGHNVAYP